jgi:hypothetical protein
VTDDSRQTTGRQQSLQPNTRITSKTSEAYQEAAAAAAAAQAEANEPEFVAA